MEVNYYDRIIKVNIVNRIKITTNYKLLENVVRDRKDLNGPSIIEHPSRNYNKSCRQSGKVSGSFRNK